MSQLDNNRITKPSAYMVSPKYTNKKWRGCWKGTNVNSTATAILSINVNLQQSIRIRTNSIFLKRQEMSLHINYSPQSDFCKA